MKIFSDDTDKAIGQAATRIVVLTNIAISLLARVEDLLPPAPVKK